MTLSDPDRIAAAIRFLEQTDQRPIRLRDVAEAAGLSEFHFQRLFTRWVGVSPNRFAQFLTIDYARTLLRRSRSVLDAALELGLSGPGRLHDLFVTIDAVTPGEFKSGGRGLRIELGEHASPFGRCLIGVTARGICWLSFSDECDDPRGLRQLRETWPEAEIRPNPDATARTASRIFSAGGVRGGRPLALVVHGTNFQLKVWEALVRIPPGQVASYGDIGRALGCPRAARAVGSAVAANPISYLIPCHRVIRSLGVPGEYRWGPARKRAMLGWEAARCAAAGEPDVSGADEDDAG